MLNYNCIELEVRRKKWEGRSKKEEGGKKEKKVEEKGSRIAEGTGKRTKLEYKKIRFRRIKEWKKSVLKKEDRIRTYIYKKDYMVLKKIYHRL